MPASQDQELLAAVMIQEYGDIAAYLVDASGVHTRTRTRYYKAAYYTSVQIIELLVYMIALYASNEDPSMLANYKIKCEVPIHDIVATKLGSSKKIYIAETILRNSTTDDILKDFQSMTAFCRSQSLIGPQMFKRLRRIQVKRNEIHLQLRSSTNRSYTKAHIDQLSDTIHKLVDIYVGL